MANDEWYTPKWLFDDLGLIFDLDVASSNNNNVAVPAKKRYTIEDNGLDQNWEGLIWMNPPYSKPTPWIAKFLDHGNGIALVPFSKSKWFVDLWNSEVDILALPPNFKFTKPDGTSHQIFMQCLLAASGSVAKEAIQRLEMRIR